MDLDSHIWAYDYQEIKQLLINAKYKQEFAKYRRLIKPLVPRLVNLDDIDLVVCVPTSQMHIRERGFDHSQYLGRLIAKKLSLKFNSVLEQAHDFVQVSSDIKTRQRLPRYICTKNLSNSNILLIDDVATTKTSLIRCAQALKKSGANRVDSATIAYQAMKIKNH